MEKSFQNGVLKWTFCLNIFENVLTLTEQFYSFDVCLSLLGQKSSNCRLSVIILRKRQKRKSCVFAGP